MKPADQLAHAHPIHSNRTVQYFACSTVHGMEMRAVSFITNLGVGNFASFVDFHYFALSKIDEKGATLYELVTPGTPSATKSSGDLRFVSATLNQRLVCGGEGIAT